MAKALDTLLASCDICRNEFVEGAPTIADSEGNLSADQLRQALVYLSEKHVSHVH